MSDSFWTKPGIAPIVGGWGGGGALTIASPPTTFSKTGNNLVKGCVKFKCSDLHVLKSLPFYIIMAIHCTLVCISF